MGSGSLFFVAKCWRCRKAKCCGKECRSTAWSEGYRFWQVQMQRLPDPINNSQLSSHRSTTTATSFTGSSSTADQRRAREQHQQALMCWVASRKVWNNIFMQPASNQFITSFIQNIISTMDTYGCCFAMRRFCTLTGKIDELNRVVIASSPPWM